MEKLASRFAERTAALMAISLAAFTFAGCASVPQSPAKAVAMAPGETGRGVADRAAHYALKLVGMPYRYGGSHPSTGFDCSGLVQFSFRQAGVGVPRSTEEQRRASQPVRVADLRPGDLLFFDQEGKKNSHVGIYVGGGTFVHAPSSGKQVRTDRLNSPYWRKSLSEARRPRA